MRSVVQEQGKYSHVEATLVKEEQVADDGGAESDGGANPPTVESSRDHDAGPGGAVTGNDVGDRSEQTSRQDERPSTVDVCERDDDEGPETGEEQVDRQLVGSLDRGYPECFAEGNEGWVDDGRAHGSHQSQARHLQADGYFQGRGPVLSHHSGQ